jgi:carbon-monoxide dehydrogenase large subunit
MTDTVVPHFLAVDDALPESPSRQVEQIRRKHGDLVLTGRGGYLDDVVLPGTLHAAVLRSPYAHARIAGIDTEPARRARGVRLVVTGAEVAQQLGIVPHFFDPALVGGRTADFRQLALDEVVYAGEPVAAVVADTLHDAQAALELIAVDYEPLPHVVDAEAALADGAPRVFDHWEDNVLIRLPFAEGDATAVLDSAEHVLEGEVRIQRYQTAPLETRGYLADWGADGRLTFHASTQNPHPLRSHLAEVLGLPETAVRVVATRLGGGFGHKFHGYPEESLVALLARAVGAPVKWVESREECMLVGAREFTHRFAVAYDDDGRILALRDRIVADIGALGASGGWGMAFVAGMAFPGPYRIKDYDVESVAVVTNKAPWNGARGYGKESAALAIERMVDLVAAELSLDPAEVRRRNFIPPDEFPYWTASKHLDSGDYGAVLDHVLELSEYELAREEQSRARAGGRLVGVGIGFELTPEGGDFSGALLRGFDTSTVRVHPGGEVTVLTGVTSPGTGNETGIAQVVAAELGISPDAVTVVQGDTDRCPYGYGNFSSRSMTVGGAAAVLAARDIRVTLAAAAGVLLETTPEKIELAGGRAFVVDAPERSMTVPELAAAVFTRTLAVHGLDQAQLESTRTYAPSNIHNLPDEQGRWSPYPSFPYSGHVATVEIDRETGIVRLVGYSGVHDCGTIINPLLVESQFLGAIVMGIGGALWEELRYDSDGRLETRTFKQYLMPRATDLPWIRTGHEVTPSPFALLGMKGSGESGVAGAVAALANAVNDALLPLGVTVDQMPLSAPRVLQAIRKAGQR